MFYPNANKEARKHVIDEVADNPMIYPPPEVAKTLFVIKPQPLAVQRLQTRMWAELKYGRSGAPCRRRPSCPDRARPQTLRAQRRRCDEHTSVLQSLMRSSYAVFCLNLSHVYARSP